MSRRHTSNGGGAAHDSAPPVEAEEVEIIPAGTDQAPDAAAMQNIRWQTGPAPAPVPIKTDAPADEILGPDQDYISLLEGLHPAMPVICDRLAAGETLTKICKEPNMPSARTVQRWALRDERVQKAYEYAKALRCEFWADQILAISEDGSKDWIEVDNGDGTKNKILDHEHIQRSRLRVDSLKWLLSKIAPRRFGDKVQIEPGGDGNGQLQIRWATVEEKHD